MAKFSDYNFGLGSRLYDFKNKEKCVDTITRYMLSRTQSMFKYRGLPDTIPQRDLELLLQINAFACIAEYDGKLYAFRGGLGGEPNVYYMPTLCTIANPALNYNVSLKINEDCVIISNDDMYLGLLPLFNRYATSMVENELSLLICDYNARIQSLINAPTDELMKSGERYLEHVVAGDMAIMGDSQFLDGIKVSPFASAGSANNITSLIEFQQYLKASLFNEIGLDANYNMKRESLNTSESQMNKDALLPFIDNMLDCRKRGVEKVNAMFGTNITVEKSSAWEDNEIELNNAQNSERSENVTGGGNNEQIESE